MSDLLARYPAISDTELHTLIEDYRSSPAIDTALLSCEDTIRAQIDTFTRDHRKSLSRGVEAKMVIAVFLASMLCIIAALLANT